MMKSVVANLVAGVLGFSAFAANAETVLVKPSEDGLNSAYWLSLSAQAEKALFGYYKLSVEGSDAIETMKQSGMFDAVEVSTQAVVDTPEPTRKSAARSRVAVTSTEAQDPNYGAQLDTYWGDYIQSNASKGAASSIASAKATLSDAPNVTVGVVDGGFFDTGDINYIGGYNFVSQDGAVRDANYMGQTQVCERQTSHGTKVASIIASLQNDIGLQGIVDADIVAAKSLSCGGGESVDTTDAIYWLAGGSIDGIPDNENIPSVINLSLTFVESCSTYMQTAIDFAESQNILVVAAAGNGGASGIGGPASELAPANCNGVVTVAALTSDGLKSQFSNVGGEVDIAAQGTAVPTYGHDGFSLADGTSFATPIVAGTLALVKQHYPSVDTETLITLMKLSSNATNPTLNDSNEFMDQFIRCKDGECGYGVLNAANLLSLVADYSDNDAFSAGHPLISAGGAECEAGVYFDVLGSSYDLCNLFEVKVGEGNGVEKGSVEVYRVTKGASLTVDNGTIINTFVGAKHLVSDFAPESYDYGFRLCEDINGCGDSLMPISQVDVTRPSDCEAEI